MKCSVIAILLFLLAACVPSQQQHVTLKPAGTDIEIDGWDSRTDNRPSGMSSDWRLKSYINKNTLAVNHQLYVTLLYNGDQKYFYRAINEDGRKMPLIKLHTMGKDCRLARCEVSEYIGVPLTDRDMQRHMHSYYSITLIAKTGDTFIVTVSPQMVQMQMDAIARYIQSRRELEH